MKFNFNSELSRDKGVLLFVCVKNEPLQIDITGSLNILENKINFKKIIIAEQNEATQEDLKFYANSFQNILINKNILDIFETIENRDLVKSLNLFYILCNYISSAGASRPCLLNFFLVYLIY